MAWMANVQYWDVQGHMQGRMVDLCFTDLSTICREGHVCSKELLVLCQQLSQVGGPNLFLPLQQELDIDRQSFFGLQVRLDSLQSFTTDTQ